MNEDQGKPFFLARVGDQFLLPAALQPQPPPVPVPAGVQYKRCNCKKAKCLKLYCVCFGAGVYCQGCNCIDCRNVPERADVVLHERQRVLQREPLAFSAKTVGPMHAKGCKCRKSRCIKKYCDCFDASVRCSELCKCIDCENGPASFGGGSSCAPAAAGGAAATLTAAVQAQQQAQQQGQQQEQQQGLLLALQQRRAGSADALEQAEVPPSLAVQLLQPQHQQPATAAEQAGMPGLPELQLHVAPLHPASQPSSRAASPTPGGRMVVLRPGPLAQLAVPAFVQRPGGQLMAAASAATNSCSSALQLAHGQWQHLAAAAAAQFATHPGAAVPFALGAQQQQQQLLLLQQQQQLLQQQQQQQQQQQLLQQQQQQQQQSAAEDDKAAVVAAMGADSSLQRQLSGGQLALLLADPGEPRHSGTAGAEQLMRAALLPSPGQAPGSQQGLEAATQPQGPPCNAQAAAERLDRAGALAKDEAAAAGPAADTALVQAGGSCRSSQTAALGGSEEQQQQQQQQPGAPCSPQAAAAPMPTSLQLPVGMDPAALLHHPGFARQLAQRLGLGEGVQQAAMSAAQLLSEMMKMQQQQAEGGASGAGGPPRAPAPQREHLVPMAPAGHDQQHACGRLRHIATSAGPPPLAQPCSKMAVLTNQPLAAIAQPAAAPPTGAAPAAAAVAAFGRLQQRTSGEQQPQAPPDAPVGSQAAAGNCLLASLGLNGGTAATPSPVAAACLPVRGAPRGPSPLGCAAPPVHEAGGGGLQALLGAPSRQQPQHSTPNAAAAAPAGAAAAAPPSGTSSAGSGAFGGSASARRSMQLLPGSFRLSGQSPQALAGVLGSPDTAAAAAVTAAALANSAVLGHVPGLAAAARQCSDSPAGSVSFGAPPLLACAAAAGAPGGQQELTPVFSNAAKAAQLAERQAQCPGRAPPPGDGQQQQPQAAGDGMAAIVAAAAAAGALTPISELVTAAAGPSAAATPTLWQQPPERSGSGCGGAAIGADAAPLQHQGSDAEAGLPCLSLFSAGAAGPAGADLMTPGSLFIASLLAARTPTDAMLGSPLQIASGLRIGPLSGARGAYCGGGGGGSGRLGDFTPVLLGGGGPASATSTGTRGRSARAGSWQRVAGTGRPRSGAGVGVSALCTGWGDSGADASMSGAAAATAASPAGGGAAPLPAAAAPATAGSGGGGTGQHDAPACGSKPDTDKAAARAASLATPAALDAGQPDGGAQAAAAEGAMSSLLAAATYVTVPVDGDEAAPKRRRPNLPEPLPEQQRQQWPAARVLAKCGSSDDSCVAKPAGSDPVPGQEDTKHAADAASFGQRGPAAAGASGQQPCEGREPGQASQLGDGQPAEGGAAPSGSAVALRGAPELQPGVAAAGLPCMAGSSRLAPHDAAMGSGHQSLGKVAAWLQADSGGNAAQALSAAPAAWQAGVGARRLLAEPPVLQSPAAAMPADGAAARAAAAAAAADRSPSIESFAAAAMLALCDVRHLGPP